MDLGLIALPKFHGLMIPKFLVMNENYKGRESKMKANKFGHEKKDSRI